MKNLTALISTYLNVKHTILLTCKPNLLGIFSSFRESESKLSRCFLAYVLIAWTLNPNRRLRRLLHGVGTLVQVRIFIICSNLNNFFVVIKNRTSILHKLAIKPGLVYVLFKNCFGLLTLKVITLNCVVRFNKYS